MRTREATFERPAPRDTGHGPPVAVERSGTAISPSRPFSVHRFLFIVSPWSLALPRPYAPSPARWELAKRRSSGPPVAVERSGTAISPSRPSCHREGPADHDADRRGFSLALNERTGLPVSLLSRDELRSAGGDPVPATKPDSVVFRSQPVLRGRVV